VKLDPAILADLAVSLILKDYVRVTPMAHAATPLGAGYGTTRFASPAGAFKVIYLAEDLATSLAETIVRDRFVGRAQRQLMSNEVDLWGATEVTGSTPLTLIDLRTTGVLRLGVATNAVRGKAQGQGRRLSQAVYEQTDADGLVYLSRLTGLSCICLYERALPGSLTASPVQPVVCLAGFIPALQALNIKLLAAP
jgi:RES domain